MSETINCLDLKGQHAQIKDEIFKAFEKVYAKTAFSGGPFVQEFEENFAKFIGTKYAIGVSSGTTALHLSMLALGIGPGDEVIMPSYTFSSTANAVVLRGAVPVFVDCVEDTACIDVSRIEAAITKKTKVIWKPDQKLNHNKSRENKRHINFKQMF